MRENRIWVIGTALLAVVIVVLGWVLAIQPQLASVNASDANRATVASTNATTALALVKLEKDFGNLSTLKTELAKLRESVPAEMDASAFVKQLNSLAQSSKVTVTSLALSDAQSYTPQAVPAPAPAKQSSATTSTSTPAPTSTTAPAVSGPITPPTTVTDPKISAANFVTVPVQIAVTGNYQDVLAFLNALQHGSRLFLVTSFSSTKLTTSVATSDSSSNPSGVTGNIGGLVYVLIDSKAAPTPAG